MVSHEAEAKNLKVIFLPFLSTSHMIPMIDMARLFALHGVDITIIATTSNAEIFQKSIDRDFNQGHSIKTHVVEFPAKEVGLPVGMETVDANTPVDMAGKIYQGSIMLQPQIENYLFGDIEVDCIISDLLYVWTVDVADKLGIPRIVFSPSSIFSRCAELWFEQNSSHTEVESDYDKFSIVGLPDKLEMTRLQLPDWIKNPDMFFAKMWKVNSLIHFNKFLVFLVFISLLKGEFLFPKYVFSNTFAVAKPAFAFSNASFQIFILFG